MQAHVMRPQMLLGIFPQCLYHNIPMILIEQTVHPRRFLEETYYWFACPVLDCNQRYNMGRGYLADSVWLCAKKTVRLTRGRYDSSSAMSNWYSLAFGLILLSVGRALSLHPKSSQGGL